MKWIRVFRSPMLVAFVWLMMTAVYPAPAFPNEVFEVQVTLSPPTPSLVSVGAPVSGSVNFGHGFSSIETVCFIFYFQADLLDHGELLSYTSPAELEGAGFQNLSGLSQSERTICFTADFHLETISLFLDGRQDFGIQMEIGSVVIASLKVQIVGESVQASFFHSFQSLVDVFSSFEPLIPVDAQQLIINQQAIDDAVSRARQVPGSLTNVQVTLRDVIEVVGYLVCLQSFGFTCLNVIVDFVDPGAGDFITTGMCLAFTDILDCVSTTITFSKIIIAQLKEFTINPTFDLFEFNLSVSVEQAIFNRFHIGDRWPSDLSLFVLNPAFSSIEVVSLTETSEGGIIGLRVEGVGVVPKDFSEFTAKLEIDRGSIELKGKFTLGAASNGINPLNEKLSLAIGTFFTSIPAGLFKQDKKERFHFEGKIGGVSLEIAILPLNNGSFEFKVEASDAKVAEVHSVQINLSIGDDAGALNVNPGFGN